MSTGGRVGALIRHLRTEQGWSQQRLAEKLNDVSGRPTNTRHDVSRWETGKRSPRSWLPAIAQVFDIPLEILEAARVGGTGQAPSHHLAAGVISSHDWREEMQRRTFIAGLASLPGLSAVPAFTINGVADQLDRRTPNDWERAVWEYGYAYLAAPKAGLLVDLWSDLASLERRIDVTTDVKSTKQLCAAGAHLASLLAMTCAHLGFRRDARYNWSRARSLSELSQDPVVQGWVRGHEITSAIYLNRPIPVILRLIDEATAFRELYPLTASEYFAGKAQVLAVLGRQADAEATIAEGLVHFDALPDRITSDRDSIFGWPPDRIQHSNAFVAARVSSPSRAEAAIEEALAQYPATRVISRSQIELTRSLSLIRGGHVQDGLGHASSTVAAVPASQMGQLILSVAADVWAAVPVAERRRSDALTYHEQLIAIEAYSSEARRG